MGIAEIDLDMGVERKALVVSHLFSAVPSKRFVELLRQLSGVVNQRVNHRLRVFASRLQQHDVACLAFDERGNLAVVTAEQQVALPVSRDSAILGAGWPLAN